MKVVGAAAAAIMMMLHTGAYGQKVWGSPSDWTVFEGEEYCAYTRDFEGDGSTEMSVSLGHEGKDVLMVTNFNWSIKADEKFDLVIAVNGEIFEGTASGVSGIERGFITLIPAEVVSAIALGSNIKFYRVIGEEHQLIDSLSLDGTGAATSLARRCLTTVKRKVAEKRREEARLAHIPKDPFSVPTSKPVDPAPATPIQPLEKYLSNDDYPASALRNEEEGTVSFRLTVSPNGRVTDCTVTSSSGSSALDNATCRVMRARARFKPAQDDRGQPTTAQVTSRFTWSINE